MPFNRSEYNQAYYLANRERLSKQKREWYNNNIERLRSRARNYIKKVYEDPDSAEKLKKYSREYSKKIERKSTNIIENIGKKIERNITNITENIEKRRLLNDPILRINSHN